MNKLFNYYGAPDADRVIIAWVPVWKQLKKLSITLTAKGEKVGIVKVHLYRPFRADKLFEAIPATVKKIAVWIELRKFTGYGEPLYVDVPAAAFKEGKTYDIVGGRYGLGSMTLPRFHHLYL